LGRVIFLVWVKFWPVHIELSHGQVGSGFFRWVELVLSGWMAHDQV
jgi:hypothetical protein